MSGYFLFWVDYSIRVPTITRDQWVFGAVLTPPTVINVDVGPTVVDQTAAHHRISRRADLGLVHAAPEDIPTVPPHLRGERQGVAANNSEMTLRRAERVHRLERDVPLAFTFQDSGDLAGVGIDLQTSR